MSTLVSGQNLKVSFRLGKHRVVEAVRDISFDVPENGTLALVGESGSGKTITALSLLRLAGNAAITGQAHLRGQRDLLVFNYISVTDSQLHIVNVETGAIRQVTRDATPVAYGNLQFAPDGRLWVSSDKDSDVQRLGVLDTQTGLFTPMIDGGRWDIVQACRTLLAEVQAGRLDAGAIDEAAVHAATALADLPPPDLFIRTGGDVRISNFLLWQLAYTELYFSDLFWPDFKHEAMRTALADFASRQRRFGKTSEQVEAGARA